MPIVIMPDGTNVEMPDKLTPELAARLKALQAGQQAPQQEAQPVPTAQPATTGSKVARGMVDPIEGGAQLLYNVLPQGVQQAGDRFNNWLADKGIPLARIPEKDVSSLVTGRGSGLNELVRQNEANYQSSRAAAGETGTDWSRIAGNIISPVNVAAASRIPQAATMAGRVGIGAGTGAMFGAAQPVTSADFWTEKAKQAGLGAVTGGVMPAITGGIARVVSPKASVNPDLKMLREAGVKPTIGQTLGGAANWTEQKATSLPLVGDSIQSLRRKSIDQFNQSAINRAVAPIGGKVDDIGHQGIAKAGDMLSAAYDDALKGLKGVTLDNQAKAELLNLKAMAGNLPDPARNVFNRTIKNVVETRLSQKGGMAADTFKIVESELSKKAASYSGSASAGERELGDAFSEALRVLRDSAARQNPKYAEALQKANAGWANLVRVEGAGKAAALNEGVFTPGQLMGAVRQADKSVRDRATARGTALMQDLAGAGQRVLGNTYPDSGTVGRAALIGTGAAGMLNLPMTMAGLGGGAALYTRPIQNALVRMAASRPQSAIQAAQTVRNATPFLAPGIVPLGYGLLGAPQ